MLYDGYFAFEAMTARKWDDGVCGIFVELLLFLRADAKNCTPLKKGQVYFLYHFCFVLFHFLLLTLHLFLNLYHQITYSEPYSGEVDVDEFWKQVDLAMIQRSCSICYAQKCTTLRRIKDSAMDTTSESQCFSAEHRNGERSAI